MNYIIFDLEFNQGFNFTKGNKNIKTPGCPFEIIQIGVVKLDENFRTISTLDRLVKPKVYNRMHPFVKKITGITMAQLNTAKPFTEVYKEFIDFVKNDRNILCVWGMVDIEELFRNIKYHQLDSSPIPREYINIQFYASEYFNCPKGTTIGLSNTVDLLKLPVKKQFHNALGDAYYTAEIFKKIYTEKIEPKIYNPNKYKKRNNHNNIKQKVDTYNLIKQFEKMFDREITKEEKSMIKLAYMMGKTNQFQIKPPNNSNS